MPFETLLHSTMHERGGGDSFEITIRPGGPGNQDPRVGAADWVLLEDGALGIDVSPTDDLPELNVLGLPGNSGLGAGGGGGTLAPSNGAFPLGNLTPAAAAVITTEGDGTDMSAGLNARWYIGGNPGTLNGQLARIAAKEEVTQFTNEQTWWYGNSTGEYGDFQQYPEEIDGVEGLVSEGNNENYMAWLSGEIELPEGDTLFRLGVDDYKYLAIDTGGNGIAGDQPGEVLMDNNNWTHSSGARGGGDWINTVVASSEDGGWTAIEVIMAEGGGGDGAILYWNADNEDDFPFAAPIRDDLGILAEDFAVPSDKLRSVERGEVSGVALKAAFDGSTLDLEVSSAFRDSDKVVLRDANFETTIDATGATINIIPLDGKSW